MSQRFYFSLRPVIVLKASMSNQLEKNAGFFPEQRKKYHKRVVGSIVSSIFFL